MVNQSLNTNHFYLGQYLILSFDFGNFDEVFIGFKYNCWQNSPFAFNLPTHCPESVVNNDDETSWDHARAYCLEKLNHPGHVSTGLVTGDIHHLAPRLSAAEKFLLIYTVWS